MLEITPSPPKFPVGAAIRAKSGTTDPDFPDTPLAGWSGTIQEIDLQVQPPNYLVKWNQHTLDQMNPDYCERCEQDGLELETMWLDEDDLELDTGGSAQIERSLSLAPVPQRNHQDDPIKVVFGLANDDPLNEEAGGGEFLPTLPFSFPSSIPKGWTPFKLAVILVLWGATCGIVLGSLLASMEIARTLAGFGAIILGLCGFMAGSKLGMIFGRLSQKRSARVWGGILGSVVGVLLGGMFGAMAVAFVGLLSGGLIGAIVGEWVRRWRAIAIFLGSVVGPTVQAFLVDREQALVGVAFGGAIGAGSGIAVVLGLRVLVARRRAR